jgi:peroxiredoxin
LKALRDVQKDIEARNATLIAISPELPDNSLSEEDKKLIPFEVLTDPDNRVARQFGLVFTLDEKLREVYKGFSIDLEKANGNGKWELPVPAVYVVNTDGTILYDFLDTDYTVRLEPSEILRILDSI